MKLNTSKFIDLFAGIGGFHQAMTSLGSECVFASEWDKHAAKVYEINYGIQPHGDITKINETEIPPHDILCGGFPCQAFSISGKQQGFDDVRGTLFFDIARIVKHHQPKILFLENVRNFEKHDSGKTLKKVIDTLTDLNYTCFYQVLNASHFGLPQNRERIYIVCFNNSLNIKSFNFPNPFSTKTALQDFLEDDPKDAKVIIRDDIQITKNYTLTNTLFEQEELPNRPIQIGKVNKGGQGERIYSPLGHAITLSAYGGGAGSKTGLYKIGNIIRKLSPRECARIQGFPDNFIIDKNPNQAYKQFGNSVAVSVLKAITVEIKKALDNE